MNNSGIEVSIIMGIYNCEDTLDESINSIINQEYKNWELIMCDDCSTDNTYKVAKKYVDMYPQKIKIIKNEKNLTLAPSLNKCIKLARGKYIARQDGDDLSSLDRLRKQVEFLENNREYDLVGSSMTSFNKNGNIGIHRLKEIPDKNDMIYGITFAHATILIKAEVMKALNGYCEDGYCNQLEDYELWSRFFLNGYKGYNLSDSLYYVREDEDAYKRRNVKRRLRCIKLRWIVARRLKFSLKGYMLGIKDVVALFVPGKVFELYYKHKSQSTG